MTNSKFEKLLENPLFKSFLFYSIFRAFYGTAILLVTWLFATNTEYPLWTSVVFLLFSMVFSRILLKKLKNKTANKEL
tara:strand:+ start:392 stop:625 length:234 start_codon:yes stop_codon:yes gene_type:complete